MGKTPKGSRPLRQLLDEVIAAEDRFSSFGAMFREARVDAGLGQAEVARLYGATSSYINRIEQGTKAVSTETAEMLTSLIENVEDGKLERSPRKPGRKKGKRDSSK